MRYKFWFALFLLNYLASNIHAQVLSKKFNLIQDKYIIFKLPIENSKDSLDVFFDTGATTALIDKEVAKKFGLKSNYSQTIAGAGGEKKYDILAGYSLKLDENHKLEGVNLVFEDLSRLRSTLGYNFDMIIGNDFLKKYLTKIDFKQKQIYFYNFDSQLDRNG